MLVIVAIKKSCIVFNVPRNLHHSGSLQLLQLATCMHWDKYIQIDTEQHDLPCVTGTSTLRLLLGIQVQVWQCASCLGKHDSMLGTFKHRLEASSGQGGTYGS